MLRIQEKRKSTLLVILDITAATVPFNFMRSNLLMVRFIYWDTRGQFIKPLAVPIYGSELLIRSASSFRVLWFTLGSYFHLALIFVQGLRQFKFTSFKMLIYFNTSVEMIMWHFFFSLFIWFIELVIFHMLGHPHIPKANVIMVIDHSMFTLQIFYWEFYFYINHWILVYSFLSYSLSVFFSFSLLLLLLSLYLVMIELSVSLILYQRNLSSHKVHFKLNNTLDT